VSAGAPAGLARRIAAGVYDLFPVAALWMVAAAIWIAPSGGRAVPPGDPFFRAWLLLVAFAYYAISWRGGQTIGMRAWKIRVEPARVPWPRLALRFAVAVVGIAAAGAGLWWSFFDEEGRCWHDLAAGTRVVRR
jgi:uncharacterized RDD family membrane protein YckC